MSLPGAPVGSCLPATLCKGVVDPCLAETAARLGPFQGGQHPKSTEITVTAGARGRHEELHAPP